MLSHSKYSNGKVNGMDQRSTHSSPTASANSSPIHGQDVKKMFEAAVNVIRNLPADPKDSKDAPFTPSDSLKLKFYAYFKQATEGPNTTPRPAFYDVIGKYKWAAWNDLGQMSKENAMKGYINELKQIVETMALTQPVSDFYEALGPFYEFVFPDKENKAPKTNTNGSATLPVDRRNLNGGLHPHPPTTEHESESEGEEFSDTYDNMVSLNVSQVSLTEGDEIITARGETELTPPRFGNLNHVPRLVGGHGSSTGRSSRGERHSGRSGTAGYSGASGGGGGNSGGYATGSLPQVNEQIAVAILRLQHSMEQVCLRLDSIENRIQGPQGPSDNRTCTENGKKDLTSWWPFDNLSPTTTAFLLAWPFVTHFLIERLRDRQHK